MPKKHLFRIGLGLAIVVVSVAAIAFRGDLSNLSAAKAQVSDGSNTSYDSSWEATKLLTVETGGPGDIAIGPARWKVTGHIGDDMFAEQWDVPSSRPVISFDDSSTVGYKVDSNPNNDWLVGITHSMGTSNFLSLPISYSPISAYKTGVADIGNVDNKQPSFTWPSTKPWDGGSTEFTLNTGDSSSCAQKNNLNTWGQYAGTAASLCMTMTGSYAWDNSYIVVAKENTKGVAADVTSIAKGVMMPLKWTVKGKYCPSSDTCTVN